MGQLTYRWLETFLNCPVFISLEKGKKTNLVYISWGDRIGKPPYFHRLNHMLRVGDYQLSPEKSCDVHRLDSCFIDVSNICPFGEAIEVTMCEYYKDHGHHTYD